MRLKARICGVLLLLAMTAPLMHARQVVDMVGRKVNVPDKIERVFAPSPYGAFMMYALAPDLMTGVVFEIKDSDRKYMDKHLWNLPVLGGGPRPGNPESLAKSNPQLLIIWKNDNNPVEDRTASQYNKMGIPYVYVVADGMKGYPAAIRYMGKLLGREKRAEVMAKKAEKILADVNASVAKVPANKRPKVYYAEGVDGLSTECNDSIHVQILQLAGDINMQRCHTSSHMGFEKISLEQLIVAQPDVILVQDKLFFDKVYQQSAWQQVKAVRDHKVYLIPRVPLNWFDRPPSFMRLLGLEWTMSNVYPASYKVNIVKETQAFYDAFLNVKLTEKEARELLAQ